MSSTSRETVRSVTAAGRTLRVAVRPGTDASVPPLLLMNGIGASLEVLTPLVDAFFVRRALAESLARTLRRYAAEREGDAAAL